jgi:thiol-disulfide isomerase/thioredoxin
MGERLGRLLGLGGLTVVGVLVLAACGSAVPPSIEARSSGAVASESQLPADFVVLVYQGQDELGGSEVQFSELLAEGKPVVLNMWAGLCPPCRLEMPDF